MLSIDRTVTLDAVTPAPPADRYPLSSGQLAIWLVAQNALANAAYSVPAGYTLAGRLDVGALRRAFEALLTRHESLRTCYGEHDGVPVQWVADAVVLDWHTATAANQAQVDRLTAEFTAREFDLATGRLLRVLLVERSATEHQLLVVAHHIAVDGWSLTVLIDEVLDAYRLYASGRAPEAVPLALQYKDYAVWQQQLLSSGHFDADRRYWQEKLAGVGALELPTDRPRPSERTFAGATIRRTLPATSLAALNSLCREEQATLFAGLTALLRVLFYRYTNQRDFALGTSTLARPCPELYDQIGYYLNSVALRESVEPSMSFRALVRAAQRGLRESMHHQGYPFDQVVRDCDHATASGRNAVFDVLVMAGQGWGGPSAPVEGLSVRHLDADNGHSKMDLTLFFEEAPSGLRVAVEYATELFDPDRIERLLDHLGVLLTAAVAAPDSPAESLPILTTGEQRQLLSEFNAVRADYDLDTPVPQLFEQQVRRTPQRVATLDENGSLTYAELNARANALAWTLREEHGIGPNTLVAVLMDRSVELMVAILGILKAGGAYLPVSAKEPAERLSAILDDSGCSLVLVRGTESAVPPAAGRNVVDVADRSAQADRTDDLPPLAGPADAGYCIYTSGSTGMPKGALIEHRSIVNRLRWMIDDLGLDERDVFLQKTPYVFDVSVWELLLPGVLGARQVMLRPGAERDPQQIRAAVDRHQVTVVHFVPSMLSRYLEAVPSGLAGVRYCVCSGEELDQELARGFFAFADHATTGLVNYYGPTEAAVDVTTLHVRDADRPITIGRPAPNNRLYILDELGRPCPVGVTGELCIAGVQVGRGYLNRPELSAERFTADPFHPQSRMYRTGDLARWTADGEIRYLGRRDNQVKIRGLRVELGEIEQVLREQPGVDRAVVLLHREPTGADYLGAYLTGVGESATEHLRAVLADRLPTHMIPSHYAWLDAIPVTRNGKADRKALARVATARSAAAGHVPARTPLEAELLEIWGSLLPPGPIGVEDDFFVLGGHSLSALQLSSRISRRYGVPMTSAAIFRHRTVAAQARLLGASSEPAESAVASVLPRPRAERHRLSYAQERLWFLNKLTPDSTAYNMRALARLDGPMDLSALEAAVHDLVERHEMLRTTFTESDGQAYQVPQRLPTTNFVVHDFGALRTDEARERVRRGVRAEDGRPFQLDRETPLRVLIFRVNATEHHLMVVLHHIAGDGWSLRLLLQQLSAAYRQRISGAPHDAAPPQLQYIDYAEAVRDPAGRAALEADLDYWTKRLSGAPTLELPADAPIPDELRAASGRADLTVPADTVRSLRGLAERTSTTLFEVTMAALNLLLSRLSDQQDVVIGFPVANRPAVELEGVVGLFLNTLALRTDLSGAPTFTELLKRVSDGVHAAYEHQAAPFELLVERLNPVRRADRTPVFDVLLNYLGTLREELEIDGVSVRFDNQLFEPEAKFPLSFYVAEAEDGGLHIDLVHRTDLFTPGRARILLEQLRSLLVQAARGADEAVGGYTLAGVGEAPAVSGPSDLALPIDEADHPPLTELIEANAAVAPDRVAVSQGARSLRYGDLVARAEAVARELIARGAGQGDVVAVTGPRGIGFVVGMLGVMRSGATVFPLDPQLPEGRRRHLLEIGRPTLVVEVTSGEPQAPVTVCRTGAPPALRVDSATGVALTDPAQAGSAAPLPTVCGDAPAYLFFTSGTTGKPRGVLGRHRSLSHFLRWQSSVFEISQTDRCAQLTSASFDVMLRDTFLALVSGGTVVVPEPKDTLGGRAVFGWLERERVTVLHAAPTVLQSWLLDAPEQVRLGDLRWTFLAGEPLKSSVVDGFRAAFPAAGEVVNLYGPTETTMAKFAYQVPYGPLPPVLPVGSPLPQCQGLVMRDGVHCGIGEPGEIVIRTPYRTFGYLDAPAANEASFQRNPHRADEADLLYRTGDIGRLRPDGLLEVVGRRDHQLKINGVRIQPAEIEEALSTHPSVSACLVTPYKVPGEPDREYHLVAYVVPADGGPVRTADLRGHLAGLLPRAMVPAEIVVLDRIPTTPNGKADRAALPAPRFTADQAAPTGEGPRTEAERMVHDLWQTVLERPAAGIHEDFFASGGTSLNLLRLFALLDDRYPGTFQVATLFAHPTVAAQAQLIEPAAQIQNEVSEYDF